jgi:uroporphyrinogen decarboxylase
MMSIFLDALAGKNTQTPPIWMMRQAGRYHSHYRAIKEKHSFEEICKTPKIAAEVALGPIQDFGFDAAILFSDILFFLEMVGYDVSFNPAPIITSKNKPNHKNASAMQFQVEAIYETKKLLGKETPLIGFVGGVATLFQFAKMSKSLKADHSSLGFFAEDVMDLYVENILLQINAGIDAFAILDSKSATQTPEYWEYMQTVIDKITGKVPIIYYANGTWHDTLQHISCIGLNAEYPIVRALQGNFGRFAVQGTFNEQHLVLPPKECAKLIDSYFLDVIENTTTTERTHWVNSIGHGIPKDSFEENIRYFIKQGRQISNF